MDAADQNGHSYQPALHSTDPHMNNYSAARHQKTTPLSVVHICSSSPLIQEPISTHTENGLSLPARDSNMRSSAPFIPRAPQQTALQRKPVASHARIGDRQSPIRTLSQDLPISNPYTMSNADPLSLGPDQPKSLFTPTTGQQAAFGSAHFASSGPVLLSEDLENGYLDEAREFEQLQYHHEWDEPSDHPVSREGDWRMESFGWDMGATSSGNDHSSASSRQLHARHSYNSPLRPMSPSPGSDLHLRGRSLTPQGPRSDHSRSPSGYGRNLSVGHSPDSRSASPMNVLNISYSQQMAQQNLTLDNAKLRGSVGANASLLDTRKTLEMYRANVKKTNDPTVSYEFALYMINAAQHPAVESSNNNSGSPTRDTDALEPTKEQTELLYEARQILHRLADRSFVFAQYYLADGYASGLFNRGKEDYEKAFPLFVSAGKHGHAESGFRAALCYEFGWGCRRDYAKAVQFYRQSASKGHPGAAGRLGNACLSGEMGLSGRYREGLTWLKRATESADYQHNSAPYELGLLHTTGFGDDIFKDEGYAAQLFTKAAELGHAEANLRMGEAYEHGLLTCPKDPALSIHFYTGAAQAGLPKAMMALCAWYMVGAEPLLEQDEAEAYEWAKRAAESGLAKAEYAVGYFTEMGIGCRRDALEANVWYVRAADQGDQRAKQRLQIIRTSETGDLAVPTLKAQKGGLKKKKSACIAEKDDKECVLM